MTHGDQIYPVMAGFDPAIYPAFYPGTRVRGWPGQGRL